MSDAPRPDHGWKNEDLHFTVVDEPPRYGERIDGPLRYVTVAAGSQPVGYLWFDDATDAANFVFCTDGGNRARNARGAWVRELLTAKAKGLTPSQAIAEFAAEVGNGRIGWIVLDSVAESESLAALQELATASGVDSGDQTH
ncbi:hypothetical protein [Glaciibacter psychrotolerans]|uniref:Uncharacterized protein n=1 Tax=Glaciibacter psychrotolerans TaxID=670054 RepID=A0A7Z0J655_9MICO|nr:hypothetical protein [Leifsonia psychrotolerans]NYJ19594.1 hypothetical protein [Leifsonia psychrotolerans]